MKTQSQCLQRDYSSIMPSSHIRIFCCFILWVFTDLLFSLDTNMNTLQSIFNMFSIMLESLLLSVEACWAALYYRTFFHFFPFQTEINVNYCAALKIKAVIYYKIVFSKFSTVSICSKSHLKDSFQTRSFKDCCSNVTENGRRAFALLWWQIVSLYMW